MSEILEEEEIKKLLVAFGRGRGERGFSIEESQCILHWAEETRSMATCLQLVLEGKVLVNWANDEIHFKVVEGEK